MKKHFKINDMHCNSCATLIENELKDKVNNVSVSFANGKADIDFDEEKITEKEIIDKIAKLGYRAEHIESSHKDNSEKTNNSSGDNKVSKYFVIGAFILLVLVLYFFVFKNLQLSGFQLPEFKIPQVGEDVGLWLLFIAGILTGFHCISMCGGFVISYTAKNASCGHKGYKQHFVYGGAKVFSYAVIGGIFGLIGGLIAFSVGLRGWVAILAGIFMVFYALSMFGIGFFKRFQFNPKFLTKFASSTSSHTQGYYKRPLITGLLNGLFIACGPLQAMYLYAMGTGSFIIGAKSLAMFGLGTLPVMLGFGSLASVISHKTTKRILKISAIVVLILGLIMINRGLILTGSEFSFNSIKEKVIGSDLIQSGGANIENGVLIINMNVDSSGYSPNSFVLKKGVPVKWNVDVKQLTGCNSELVVNDYGIDVKLKKGLNLIEFTPDKIGTIRFSCGMGMIRGSFIVTETGTASQQQVTASSPKSSGGTCTMGANGGGCGCGG